MGSEDFSIMLARRPGAFVWLGGGAPGKDWGLPHPKYDFNDDALPVGASFLAKLVEAKRPRAGRGRHRDGGGSTGPPAAASMNLGGVLVSGGGSMVTSGPGLRGCADEGQSSF